MQVKIDLQLNCRFGVVERLIFRFVLNGFSNACEISLALPIFSDAVIANAIKRLVNFQILSADVETGTLSLSEPLVAIVNMCLENTYEIDIPDSLKDEVLRDGLLIAGGDVPETVRLKDAILRELIPGVKLDLYLDSLNFVIFRAGTGDVDG